MRDTLKIVIPMAGLGTRMRPHTWSKPKPLIALAGRTVLDYVLEQFRTLPEPKNSEYIFIIGPQGWPIKDYLDIHYPDLKCHYVVQEEMLGQSHALSLAGEFLKGPMLMAFSDTLIETDLSNIGKETCDGIAWVKPVPDPRRFGVAEVNPEGMVARLVEKPEDMSNNLVVVGFYYFANSETLLDTIQEQMRSGKTLKNEFFLADAINIFIERGAKMRPQLVETWLDAGIPEALLETNRYMLEHGHDNSDKSPTTDVCVIPPVFIHPSSRVEHCVIGPYTSIGRNCVIADSVVRNSIVGDESHISTMVLEDSLIGDQVELSGKFLHLNLGDNSWLRS
jgi:glucose-1-phosphate thymidylyltransferase